MARKIAELREQRARLIEDARAILEKPEAEKRELTAEEKSNYDKAFTDAQALKAKIETEERQLEAEREIADQERRSGKAQPGNDNPAAVSAKVDDAVKAELRSLYRKRYSGGDRALSEAERSRIMQVRGSLLETAEHQTFNKYLASGLRSLNGDEVRSLNFGSDTAGGFAVPPEDFMNELIMKIDDFTFIRGMATKMMVVKAQDLGVPTLENNPADSDWTSELATGSEDTTMSFGKRQFQPHPLAKLIKISRKLLAASAIPIEELIRDRFTYKFGITQEKAFLTGNGAGVPLGLFTASANGIPTTQDVSTGNTTTAISSDGLVNALYTLKAPYRKKAAWLFHRNAVAQIMTLKDGDGQYLWKAGLQMGQPDMLLGRPLMESEYVPNTFTTGLYVGMIGDFSFYWIADALDMTIQRLDELYAATNQVGFIMRVETDGMPVLAEPFVRVKLA